MPTVSDAPLLRRPAWSVRLPVDPEYAGLRHVGNLEFARLFQEARLGFSRYLVGRMQGVQHFGDQMIVHISMDFAREILWSPDIEVHVRVGNIGRSSYELDLSIWDGDTVAVRSKTVNVWMEDDAPAPINDEARALLAASR